jgi:hypothetical protein
MVNWLIIGIIILTLIVLLKVASFKHRIAIVIAVFLVLFFYLSFAVIARNQAMDFKTVSGLTDAGKLYFSWIGNAFSNLRTITGNVVDMEWIKNDKNLTDYNPRNVMKG